jgi:hypothetical protein
VLRHHAGEFLHRYPQLRGVEKTLRSLAACRTAALGGQAMRCDHCSAVTYRYHSCGNRHCPQCGGNKRAAWLDKRMAELLPVPYFHVVFTVPHELSALMMGNRRVLYKLLFDASAQTLLKVAAEKLGAKIGVLSVLHTWGQRLEHHPHVHCVVPGGGLSLGDVPAWKSCRPKYLLPWKVLGKVFRGKFMAGLCEAFKRGALQFGGSTAELAEEEAFERFKKECYAKNWVVYAKPPFGGPEQVLKYLAKYTHRVAIGNSRLVKREGGQVTFRFKDYADGHRVKELTLDAVEFVRRFTLHVLPRGLVRVRQYGLLANRGRGERLAQCRRLLQAAAAPAVMAGRSARLELQGLIICLVAALWLPCVPHAGVRFGTPEPEACPSCGVGHLVVISKWDRPTAAKLARRWRWEPP